MPGAWSHGVPKAEALAALMAMFDSGEVVALGHARSVLGSRGLATAKLGFVDRLIHAGYEAGSGGMATFEKKACRLGAVRVLRG